MAQEKSEILQNDENLLFSDEVSFVAANMKFCKGVPKKYNPWY